MCTIGDIRVKVGLSRKEGTEHYGSIGASIEVEVQLHGATPGDVQAQRDHWLSWCAEALDRAIADQRGGAATPNHAAPAPAPAGLPAPSGPTGKPQQTWGTAYPSAGAPAPPPGAGGAGGRRGAGNPEGAPRSGGGLYARLKGMDEQNPNLKIVQHVKAWAKGGGNDARFSDWSPEWVQSGWGEAERYLEALRESERLQGAGY